MTTENKAVVVEVFDRIMGSGKTTGITNWMNNNPQNKYLYISPTLTEVESRIPDQCAGLEFVFPNTQEHKTKGDCLYTMLQKGENIAFSHSLFMDMRKKHLDMIAKQEYVLVIDEEVSLISPYSGRYTRGDVISLEKAQHIKVHDDDVGRIEWLWQDMEEDTAYSMFQGLCQADMLYCSKRDRDILVIHLPMQLIQSAQRVILLTYLFNGSVMDSFLRLKGVSIIPFTEIATLKTTKQIKEECRSLITLVETPSTKSASTFPLSSSWYSRNSTQEDIDKISNAIRSIYRKYGNKDNFLYTVPKEIVFPDNIRKNTKMFKDDRWPVEDCWLHSSCRATNLYATKSVLVHAFNRYVNLPVQAYLQDYAHPASDDAFALSEMVQWIWRGCIRDSKPITLCIISNRMRALFKKWLDDPDC